MKLHEAFPFSEQLVGEEHFLLLLKLLQRKRNAWILLCSEKAVEIPENKAAFVSDINDHAAAGLYWLGS